MGDIDRKKVYFVQRYTSIGLFGGIGLITLICGLLAVIVNWTPLLIPNWGSAPLDPRPILPSNLDCSTVNTVAVGPDWNGLKIGISTLGDVRLRLLPVTPTWNLRKGNLRFASAHLFPDEAWSTVEACFVNNKLAVLNIRGSVELSAMVREWIMEKRKWSFVTWSNDYYSRTVVWGDEGVLAVIGVRDELPANIMLFPKMTNDELMNSWIIQALPLQRPPHVGDVAPLPPNLNVQNPWASP